MTDPPTPDDMCHVVRESLSARLDDEPGPLGSDECARHLEGCPACRAWQHDIHALTRRVRLTPARPGPDRVDAVVDAVLVDRAQRAGRAPGRIVLRVVLVATAAAQLAVVVPALVLGRAGLGVPLHASRELGAFNLALAVGFGLAALNPRLARGAFTLAATATSVLVAVSLIDAAVGQTTLVAELPHLVAVAGTVLLAALGRREHRPEPQVSTSPAPASPDPP